MSLTSYLSPKCRTGRSSIGGLGVFAGQWLDAGELVAIWGGKIYSHADIEQLASCNPSLLIHPLMVADGFYIGPSDATNAPEAADYFNHSCDPNAGVKGQIVLIARRAIAAGEEICFDYETTEREGSVGMGFDCHCGTSACRGHIEGLSWHEPAFQQRNHGFMSWHLSSDPPPPCS